MALIPLTSEQEESVLETHGYNRVKLAEDVAIIRSWLKRQEHLPSCRNRENDTFITNFLLGCKGKLSSVKKKIDAYYTLRSQYTLLFGDRNPETVERSAIYLEAMTMPDATADGCRVSAALLTSNTNFVFEDCLKRVLIVLEIRLRTEVIYGGDFVFVDVQHFVPKLIFKVSLPLFHQFLQYILKAIPYRLKGLIFYNTCFVFELGINRFLKPFLKSQIAKRIYMYSGGHDMLQKHLDVNILPKDLGGTKYEINSLTAYWIQTGRAWKEWFLTDGSDKTDESKRPKKKSRLGFFWKGQRTLRRSPSVSSSSSSVSS